VLKAAKPAGTQRIAAVWSSAFTRLGPPEGGTPNGVFGSFVTHSFSTHEMGSEENNTLE